MEAKSILGEKEIDVYSVARMPPGIDKEAIWNLLKSFKEEGLIREVGASELGAASMEQMHKVGASNPNYEGQHIDPPSRSSQWHVTRSKCPCGHGRRTSKTL